VLIAKPLPTEQIDAAITLLLQSRIPTALGSNLGQNIVYSDRISVAFHNPYGQMPV
jgi:hypothetical protein